MALITTEPPYDASETGTVTAAVALRAVLLQADAHLGKLRTPDAYAKDPAEAATLFCGRFLQLMVWEPQVRTCRLSIAEAERLPGSSNATTPCLPARTSD